MACDRFCGETSSRQRFAWKIEAIENFACKSSLSGSCQLKNAINAEVHAFSDAGYIEKMLVSQRRKLFDAFQEFKGPSKNESILDVCILSTGARASSSCLQSWIGTSDQAFVKACNILVSPEGPWRLAQAESGSTAEAGMQTLPFANGQFDWVFCGEVMERAGTRAHQLHLLRELSRIARKGVFVTTENRKHPIEFTTGLPLMHWLPEPLWRVGLKLCGKGEWASREMLNPLGSDTLKEMSAELPDIASSDIGHLRVAGVKAHFFLMLRKQTPQLAAAA